MSFRRPTIIIILRGGREEGGVSQRHTSSLRRAPLRHPQAASGSLTHPNSRPSVLSSSHETILPSDGVIFILRNATKEDIMVS